MNQLETALGYAARGWWVFPIYEPTPAGCSCGKACGRDAGKHPRLDGGCLAATREPELIKAWWTNWPNANIGLATGAKSGLWILDVDGDKGGADELRALEAENGQLPEGPRSLTGNGVHFLFAWPAAGEVRNTQAGEVAPGIDSRGTGGYVVAAGSLHRNGREYTWEADTDELALPEAPAWLLERVLRLQPVAVPPAEDELHDRPGVERDQAEEVGSRILTWAIDKVNRGSGRNGVGFELACQLRDNQLSIAQARPWLDRYAARVGNAGDHPYVITEAAKSLRQAYSRKPRDPWTERVEPVFGGPRRVTEEEEAAAEAEAARPIRNTTDLGNAERFADRYGTASRFVFTWERWLVWDGVRWRQDETDAVVRLAKEVVRAIYRECERVSGDKDFRKALANHAHKSEASRAINAMLTLARAEEGIGVRPEDLDRHPWLVNCRNGTLDLRTGVLGPHRPEELHSKVIPVDYREDAACPRWEAFLTRVMDGDADLVGFLRRSVGYWLTGSTREQCLWILHGSGSNGKSTFLDVVRTLLADYGQQADPKSFIERKTESISNDLAALKGARLVVASETEAGRRLAEGLVKQVTGGEPIVARFLHREFFQFQPEFKLALATNHKPQIRGTDHAIWRRIRLTPFEVTIPPEERNKDLKAQLLEELPGILAWAVRGALEWQQVGLQEPAKVIEATDDYRESMDTMGTFFEECCELGPAYSVKFKNLFAVYLKWAERSHETPQSKKTFGISLGDRGLRSAKHGGERVWIGIRLGVLGDDGEDQDSDRLFGNKSKTFSAPMVSSSPSSPSSPSPCSHPSVYQDGSCSICGEMTNG